MKEIELVSVDRKFLASRISADDLGIQPRRVWCLTPSSLHRTAPYKLPKTIRIGVRDTKEAGAKFSPSPFAVCLEGKDGSVLVGISAQPGWHRWNTVEFIATNGGIEIRIDLEGHTSPKEASDHIRAFVLPGTRGELPLDLLSRSARISHPRAFQKPSRKTPEWWNRPIYCGYGDQVGLCRELEGPGPEARALSYCTQGLYERWIKRLDEADVPFGTIIIDAGWSDAGRWEPYPVQWPDMRSFMEGQHEKGRRVLLWLPTWLNEGLPDEWCLRVGTRRLVADPTNPRYRAYIRKQIHRLLSPARDGFNADGFKIDQLGYVPTENEPRGGEQFGRAFELKGKHSRVRIKSKLWGCELLYQLQKDIYRAAKSAKRDALITSSTVHPYFHDTFDMVRLHDTGKVDVDVFAAMEARAKLAKAVLPNLLIDADDWVHSDYRKWLDYTMKSFRIGVPCTFYAERFVNFSGPGPPSYPIPLKDLRRIAKAWRKTCRRSSSRRRR